MLPQTGARLLLRLLPMAVLSLLPRQLRHLVPSRLAVASSLLFSKLPVWWDYACEPEYLCCDSRNIVATVNLDCRLDLKTIALHARNAEYSEYHLEILCST